MIYVRRINERGYFWVLAYPARFTTDCRWRHMARKGWLWLVR